MREVKGVEVVILRTRARVIPMVTNRMLVRLLSRGAPIGSISIRRSLVARAK